MVWLARSMLPLELLSPTALFVHGFFWDVRASFVSDVDGDARFLVALQYITV